MRYERVENLLIPVVLAVTGALALYFSDHRAPSWVPSVSRNVFAFCLELIVVVFAINAIASLADRRIRNNVTRPIVDYLVDQIHAGHDVAESVKQYCEDEAVDKLASERHQLRAFRSALLQATSFNMELLRRSLRPQVLGLSSEYHARSNIVATELDAILDSLDKLSDQTIIAMMNDLKRAITQWAPVATELSSLLKSEFGIR